MKALRHESAAGVLLLLAAVSVSVSVSAPAQGLVRPGPGAAAQPAQTSPAPVQHAMQVPGGLMRVMGAAPVATAKAATAAAGPATAVSVVDGVSMRLPAGASPPAARSMSASSRPTMATSERVLPGGARMRIPATGDPSSSTNPVSPTTPFAIVDIDAAGHTASPGAALRTDVRFRRVNRLSSTN